MTRFDLCDTSRLCEQCRAAVPPLVLLDRMIARRRQLGMSRFELAKRLGIHHRTLTDFETRKRRITQRSQRWIVEWLALPDDQARHVPPFADGWPEDSAEFAWLARMRRKAAGLSVDTLSLLSGLCRSTIQRFESGHRRRPEPQTRRRLVAALDKIPRPV